MLVLCAAWLKQHFLGVQSEALAAHLKFQLPVHSNYYCLATSVMPRLCVAWLVQHSLSYIHFHR